MAEKVKFGVYLNKELIERFRCFVAEQYGKVGRGLISFEVAQALDSWMSTHKGTQAQLATKGPNPLPNVFIVKEQVKSYLMSQFGYENIYKIPKKQVEIAIGALRGTDSRTIEKWIKLFEKYGVMKWITPNVVEFL
jgi:hypothetical protein